ncbi:MAG: YadA-like family protein [Pusillimonas sp.]
MLSLGAVVLAGAGLLGASASALADVTIGGEPPVAGNSIVFSNGAGTINMNGGTISGLTDSALVSGGTNAVTTGQLWDTNEELATVNTTVTNLGNTVTNLGTTVGDHTTLIGANATAIGNLQTASATAVSYDSAAKDVITLEGGAEGTRITNLTNGAINATSTDAVTGQQIHNLFIEEGAGGVRYFHASSAQADSEALGDQSIAIGPNTVAEGDNSFAAGDGASTTEPAEGAIALGQNAQAGDDDYGVGAIAIGRDSIASDTGSVALGDGAQASAGNATALGASANASGAGAIALGDATAGGPRSFAAGVDAYAGTQDSIALGTGTGVGSGTEVNDPGQRHSFIAIGKNAGRNMDGNQAIAIGVGAGSNTVESDQISIGTEAGTYLEGERNVSIGFEANHYTATEAVRHATAIGGTTIAATDAVAVGYGAHAITTESVAIGAGSRAEDGSIAIGHNSHATQVTGASYLTGQAFTGESVSVGNATTGLTRRITNVEDGADGYDAVNVNQLEELKTSLGSFDPQSGGNVNYNADGTISVDAGTAGNSAVNLAQMNNAIAEEKPKFYSVNPNGDNMNENGDGALGPNSANSMAIGHAAKIDEAERATAMGYSVLVKADDGTALGSGSTVNNTAGVAIGKGAYSRGDNSIAMGTNAQTERKDIDSTSTDAIAIGTSSRATDDSASALGHHATASGWRSSALGYMANASNTSAMAFGTNSAASGVDSQASGTRAGATRTNAQASGTDAKAYATDAIAIGTGATSGQASPALADQAGNIDTIAIGHGALAIRQNAFASGTGAEANAMDAMAMGTGARASEQSAVAIGQGAVSGNARSVALGNNAATDTAVGTTNAALNGITYGNFSGNNPIATVSVGTEQEKRTITNVAAGRISSTSTDAINGSQLYATNAVLGNVANTTVEILGGNAALAPDGNLSMGDIGGTGEDTVHDAIQYAAQGWNISADGGGVANVAPGGSVDFGNTDENIVVTRNGTDLSFDLADDLEIGNSITIGDTLINGDSVTTNNLTVEGNTQLGDHFAVNGGGVYYSGPITDGDHVTNKTYVDGAVGDLADTPLTFAGDSGTNVTRRLGQTVNLTGGASDAAALTDGNIGVQANGTDTLAIKLNKDIDLGANGSVKIGDALVNNDGLIVGDGTGPTTTVGAGTVTVWANPTTGAANEIVIDANTGTIGGLTNTTFDPDNFASGQAATEDQLKSVSDVANAGWNLSANGATSTQVNIGPNGDVIFNGDSNITVTQTGADDDGVINVALNENIDLGADGSVTTGDTVLDNTGLTVNDASAGTLTSIGSGAIALADNNGNITTIDPTSITVGGANTITISGATGTIGGLTNTTFDPDNFASGQAATEDQLKSISDVASAGWNLSANGATSTQVNIGPNGDVIFNGDSNITVTQTGADDDGVINVALNEDIDLGPTGSITIGNSLMDNSGLAVDDGAGNKTTTSATGTTVTDGVKTTQVTAEGTTMTDGSGNTATTTALGTTVEDSTGQTTQVGAGSITVANGTNTVVINSATGDITGLTNVDFSGTDFGTQGRAATEEQLQLARDETQALDDRAVKYDLNPDNTVNYNVVTMAGTISPATQDADGRISTTGGTQITNVASAGDYNDVANAYNAVNAGDLNNAVQDVTSTGMNFSANTGTDVHRDLGQTLAIRGGMADTTPTTATSGENVITRTTADGISIELARDATFDSLTTGATVMDTDGVRIGTTVALTNTGMRAGNIVISSATGDIIGLSNTTLTAADFATQGRAATEEQLKLVRGETQDLADRAVKYDGNVGDPKNKITLEGDVSTDGGRTGGTQITNVARGDISENSTDAVNGSQIHDMGNSIAAGMGGNSQFVDGKLVTELNVGGNAYNNVNDALNGVQTNIDEVAQVANAGWQIQANGDEASKVAPGKTVEFVDGDNIEITRETSADGNNQVKVSMSKDIAVESVSANTVNAKQVVIENGPSIKQDGIDMNDRRITNLADGINDTDAVNVGQLNQATGNINNQINRLDGRVNRVENRANAGIATALAAAALPQAYMPGKSMFSLGGGTWNGESGYAMGLSTVSDNGKWLLKGSAVGSSRGDYGAAVGVGYQW